MKMFPARVENAIDITMTPTTVNSAIIPNTQSGESSGGVIIPPVNIKFSASNIPTESIKNYRYKYKITPIKNLHTIVARISIKMTQKNGSTDSDRQGQ